MDGSEGMVSIKVQVYSTSEGTLTYTELHSIPQSLALDDALAKAWSMTEETGFASYQTCTDDITSDHLSRAISGPHITKVVSSHELSQVRDIKTCPAIWENVLWKDLDLTYFSHFTTHNKTYQSLEQQKVESWWSWMSEISSPEIEDRPRLTMESSPVAMPYIETKHSLL